MLVELKIAQRKLAVDEETGGGCLSETPRD